MRNGNCWILALLCCVSVVAAAAPQRTFVASSGIDTNPCSITAPCRSFASAVAVVTDGGEVVALDSAGYGAVTITKSVSIVAPSGVYAGISVFSGAGITVDGAGIVVALRGLSVVNQGGGVGIYFLQGTGLHVENCEMSGLSVGISIAAVGSITHIVDTIVRDGTDGIVANGSLRAIVSRTRVERHALSGIRLVGDAEVAIEDSVVTACGVCIHVNPQALGFGTRATVARTLVAVGTFGISAETAGMSSLADVTVMDSTIVGMAVAGIAAQEGAGTPTVTAIRNQLLGNATAFQAVGPAATLILDANAVVKNATGVHAMTGATVVTRGNSTVTANGTDTVGTPYTPLSGI